MYLGSPIDAVADSIYSALYKDFDEIEYDYRKPGTQETEKRTRRLRIDEMEVIMFPQTWSDTSLGFGGMAGQAMSAAYTVIVTSRISSECLVYVGGRLAHKASRKFQTGYKLLQEDIAAQSVKGGAQRNAYMKE